MKMLISICLILSSLSLVSSVESGFGGGVGLRNEPTTNGVIPERKPLPDYFKSGSKHPLGVRPDCSETKVEINQIEDLAKSGKINSTVDFLNSLPPDSFQTFSLVTNSKSLQRGEGEGQVSDQWPRVIRSSVDGRITMSYTCNPKSSSFNKIEVMYYDDKGKEINTLSLDLTQKPDHRLQKNEAKCLNCHSTQRPDGQRKFKPIWPEYPQWAGCKESNGISMYGGNDDTMNAKDFRSGGNSSEEYEDCSNESLRQRQIDEIANFKKFKENNLGTGEKNNPCYSTLPWAKPEGGPETPDPKTNTTGQYDPAKYEFYPYTAKRRDSDFSGNSDGNENMYLRTNLRIGANYSTLNAKRIAGEIMKSPNYEKIKYFISMEAAGCLKQEDEKVINQLIPGLNFQFQERNLIGHDSPGKGNPLMFAYANSIGIPETDWSIEFNAKKSSYLAAIARSSVKDGGIYDTGMADYAAGEITTNITKADPKVAETMKDGLSRGLSEGSGAQWSCIDDAGGAIRKQFQGNERPLCKSLRASVNEYLKTQKDCLEIVTEEVKTITTQVEKITTEVKNDPVSRGKELVKGKCMDCHDNDNFKNFSPAKLKSQLSASGNMPLGGEKLSQEEQNAVIAYISSLKAKP